MKCLFISLLLLSITGTVYSFTCEGMDDKLPIIQGAARAACIASCNIQNCATGNCVKAKIKEGKKTVTRKTCKCSRCDKGSIVSVGVSLPIPGLKSAKKGKSDKGKKAKNTKKA
ncbi:unnamed protein product [Cylicocyclus nassatus]|uniref:Uncharacterized protein n=1 Tax=Cylicocyclus nassatus TaxID=53992 RepID=A0AA36GLY8_CYLNA|nr:unnamed protein product [Cylicocyclus nassatus]